MAHRRENKPRPGELDVTDKENKKDKADRKRKKASSSSGTSSDSSSVSESSSGTSSSGSSSGSSSRSSSSSSSSTSSGYSDGIKRKRKRKTTEGKVTAKDTIIHDEKQAKAVGDEKPKKPERPRASRADRSVSPRRRRSPTPRPTKIHIGRLTRNVTREHVREIFATFGVVKAVDFPLDRNHPNLGKGFAYAEFETADDAENAMRHMDGGQIDGQEITAAPVLVARPRVPPPRRPSPVPVRRGPPPRWGGGGRPGPRFRHNSPPPRPRVRSPPPRRRPRSRPRSRSPARRRRYSRSSSSTSR